MADPFKLNVTIEVEFTRQRIAYLLSNAFEGGYSSWARIEKFIKPPDENLKPVMDEGDENPKIYRQYDYPLCEGGALLISDYGEMGPKEMRVERLDLETIEKGLKIFAEKYPKHFSDFRTENDDAITGDVFLQCCLFGEAVYG